MRICKKCGNEVSDFNAACPHCGNTIELDEIEEEYKDEMDVHSSSQYTHMSLTRLIIFTFLTLGIYFFVYMERFRKEVNQLCTEKYDQSRHFIVVALLSIVTFGIYYLYWLAIQMNRINRRAQSAAITVREKPVTLVLLTLFLPVIGFFGAIYILFDNFNRVVAVVEGYESASEINKRPGHGLFIFMVVISGFIWNTLALVGYDHFFDSRSTYEYSYITDLKAAEGKKDNGLPNDNLKGEELNDDDGFAYGYYDESQENQRPAGSVKYAVNIVNDTDMDFTGISVSLAGKNKWHDLTFEKGYTLKNKGTITIPVYVVPDDPKLDIVFIDEDRDLHTIRDVDLTQMNTYSPTMKVYNDEDGITFILKDTKE